MATWALNGSSGIGFSSISGGSVSTDVVGLTGGCITMLRAQGAGLSCQAATSVSAPVNVGVVSAKSSQLGV